MAQTLDCRPDIRRTYRKKRLVAESTQEALRAWNDAKELEQCTREEDFVEMYPHLGDAEKLEEIRSRVKNRSHCAFLRKDSNACHSLPSGFDGVEAGTVCPHNVYHHQSQVFEHREGVADTIERLFRLLNSAEIGIISESSLDPLTVTELITARNELDKQQADKSKREHERSRLEAQVNQKRDLPSWGK